MAVCTAFLHEGIDFDLDCKRYRLYTGLHRWKIGAWKQMPTIVGVTIKYFSELVTTEDETGLRTDKNARLILMLSVANSSQGIIIQQFDLTEKKFALITGERIAAILRVPLAPFMCAKLNASAVARHQPKPFNTPCACMEHLYLLPLLLLTSLSGHA